MFQHGVGPFALLVDEVDPHSVDIGLEMAEGIDQPLLGPPVEPCAPVFHQFLDVVQVAPIVSPGAGDFIWPAGVCLGGNQSQFRLLKQGIGVDASGPG